MCSLGAKRDWDFVYHRVTVLLFLPGELLVEVLPSKVGLQFETAIMF